MIKKLHISIVSILMIGLMFSCSTSNDVASNRGIQKRKYNKGFYVEKGPKLGGDTKQTELVENENILVETPVALDQPTERISSAPEVIYVEEVEETLVELTPDNAVEEELDQTPITTTAQQEITIEEEEVELKPIQKFKKMGSTFMKKGSIKRAKEQLNKAKEQLNENNDYRADAILYYILAFLLPWLAVGLVTGWDPMLTLISVVLWFCFWIPGIIFALIVVSNNV